jgi:hypothetical protein
VPQILIKYLRRILWLKILRKGSDQWPSWWLRL